MIFKSFKTEGITLTLDGSEGKMFISYNPFLEDDQVMFEHVEQPVDKQDEGMKDKEINDNNNNSDRRERGSRDRVFLAKGWNENIINFRWSDIRGEDEEDIAKLNWLRVYKSKLAEIFHKKATGWLFLLLRHHT